jgi:hypothetical protein
MQHVVHDAQCEKRAIKISGEADIVDCFISSTAQEDTPILIWKAKLEHHFPLTMSAAPPRGIYDCQLAPSVESTLREVPVFRSPRLERHDGGATLAPLAHVALRFTSLVEGNERIRNLTLATSKVCIVR